MIKCKDYYLDKYGTFEELGKAIDEYIYFYNYDRLQGKLNDLNPMEFRIKAALVNFIFSTFYLTGDSSVSSIKAISIINLQAYLNI